MGKVGFSWEKSPGMSKNMISLKEPSKSHRLAQEHGFPKLPPPPCLRDSPKVLLHDLRVRLPPCPSQPPMKSSSKRGLDKISEDPFLAAYLECTKSGGQPRPRSTTKKDGSGRGMKVGMNMFSCKFSSCGVKEDGLMRMVHQPLHHRLRSAKME